MKLSVILWGIPQAMRVATRMYPEYAERLKEKNMVAQLRLRDKPEGRWIKIESGRVLTGRGIHERPDITIDFKN
ncbi:MAG TPA: hypothetical protein PKM58_01620, partial [Pyrinomonadaceae bacterium]|nr:hypothetical protein [Pyrinomonadaceae bacterium]